MKRAAAALAVVAALALLSGCSSEPTGPSPFEVECLEQDGVFVEDTVTETVSTMVTGTLTGTVFVDGKVVTGTGIGTGLYTGPVTLNVRACVVDGEIKDMEIR
ncbi:hypothetical protein PBI_DEWDROP_107 [Microbacterium phage Dewdrop]|nr:hypothetical protein PBI_LEAF_107 [Microbacterium phage Leaf]QGZ17475.1 hypothetical protein PBI_DEWDROP_107 [Microbacterium phage Dewdrop]